MSNAPSGLPGSDEVEWTCVLPFYNEAPMLQRTLASLAGQKVPFKLVLVDNGSTDGSGEVAQEVAGSLGIDHTLLDEWRPGKVAALAAGIAVAATMLIATCDADTFYPPDYLDLGAQLLSREGFVAVGAFIAPEASLKASRSFAVWRRWLAALLWPQQCHTGGAGQMFRADALRGVGGFCVKRWNLVLEDHEIFARLSGIGRIGYSRFLWCAPVSRRHRRRRVGWSRSEQLLYHVTPKGWLGAFFANFLGPRLHGRGQSSERLRADPPGK
jgi:glycosyltransferase involved in cell wall biosynthesis